MYTGFSVQMTGSFPCDIKIFKKKSANVILWCMQVLWIWHRTCIRIKNYCLFALHPSTNRKEVSSRYLNYKLSTSWASHSRTWSQIKFKAEMFKKKKRSRERVIKTCCSISFRVPSISCLWLLNKKKINCFSKLLWPAIKDIPH